MSSIVTVTWGGPQQAGHTASQYFSGVYTETRPSSERDSVAGPDILDH